LRLTSERRARWPEDAQNEREELMALGWYSVAQLDLGETRRARDGLEEIVARARGLIESDPGDRTAHQALGFLLQRLGRARLADGDPQGSLRAHDEALRLFSEDVKRTGGEREALLSQAEALLEVGEAHRASARPEDSLEAYRQACSVLLELETRQPQAIDVARKLAGALARLGDAALNAGDGAAAAGHYAQAQQRIERAAAADPAHAWTQRMVMVIRGWRGVAHRAAAQRAAAAERTTHLDAAIQALESALMLEPDLNAAGFLRPNDEAAIEKLIADLEDCRFERTGAREP
jgi:tetratricopeptide (TPR) repeat protein